MRKIKWISPLALCLLILINAAPQVLAEEIALDGHGKVYKGRSWLSLRQMLDDQHPWSAHSEKRLKKVILVAKSRFGHGSAALKIKDKVTQPKPVPGNDQAWQSHEPHTYHHIVLNNPKPDSLGAWQLRVDGHIRVREIIVHLDQGPGGKALNTDLTIEVPIKTTMTTRTFTVNMPGVRRIVVQNVSWHTRKEDNTIKVHDFAVVYEDNHRESLDTLFINYSCRPNSTVGFSDKWLPDKKGRFIKKAIIRATVTKGTGGTLSLSFRNEAR